MENIENSKEIVSIRKSNQVLVEKVKNLKVTSKESSVEASQFLVWIAGAKKKLESKRLEITKPLNDSLRRINTMFKQWSLPLIEAEAYLRNEMIRYNAEVRRKIEEENKKLLKAAKKVGIETEGIKIEAKPDIVRTGQGSVSSRKFWTFKVKNLLKVPREYLKLDEVKVRTAIREGVRKIDGLEIYEEETLTVVNS